MNGLEKQEWRRMAKSPPFDELEAFDELKGDSVDAENVTELSTRFESVTDETVPSLVPKEEGSPYASPQTWSDPSTQDDESRVPEGEAEFDSPRGLKSWFGLPYGLPSILITSALFALAHLGNGPDPVPLFLFGLIVGYVYQRTHRILPCVLAHMLFNGFSLLLLTLEMSKPVQ